MSKIFIISVLILNLVFSLFILLVLDSAIKYFLYLFNASLGAITLLIIFNRNKSIQFSTIASVKVIDYFFISSAVLVFIFNLINISLLYVDLSKFWFSLIDSFFLPGWVFLRLLNIYEKINKIPLIVLSFSISIGLSSIIYSITLSFKGADSPLFLPLVYIVISVSLLLKQYYTKINKNSNSLQDGQKYYNFTEIITLIWILLFFFSTIFSLYPQFAFVPGNDIIRHYSTILKLKDLPYAFHSEYPWFHFSLATLNDLSKAPIWLFQLGTACLSIIMIFSFHIMSKTYLSVINRYIHLFATICFTTFSGFGWIYSIWRLPFLSSFGDHFNLLSFSFYATYYDVGIGQSTWLWFWFRPITMGFTIFFVLLYFMRNESIGKKTFLLITSILSLILSLTHFSELSIFVVILFIVSIIFPKINLRIRETLISVIISLIFSFLFSNIYLNLLGSNSISSHKEYLVLLFILSMLALIFLKYPNRVHLTVKVNYKTIISAALSVYAIIFIYWLTNNDVVKRSIINMMTSPIEILAVPSAIYPILLGIAGIFAIPSFIIIFKQYKSNPIVIFPLIFISVIFLGKMISFININFTDMGYWERRLIPYIWMSVSFAAPITIYQLSNYINQKRLFFSKHKNLKKTITASLISLLILGGTLSTYLSIDYQMLLTSRNAFGNNEKYLLDTNFKSDPHSTLLTSTFRSSSLAEYADFNYIIGYYKFQIWPSITPELPLNILNGLNNSAIIYMNKADMNEIKKDGYEHAYLASHIIKITPRITMNQGNDIIFQIPRLSPPTPNSKMLLVLPNNMSESHYYAYDILSQGKYNYTTAKLFDIPTIKTAKIIIVPNDEIASILINLRNIYNLQFNNIILLNLDGYGNLININGTDLKDLQNHYNSITSQDENNYFDKFNSITSQDENKKLSIIDNVSLEYQKPLNLANYDFFKINWYAQGNNLKHILTFLSSSNKEINYTFYDSDNGLKQIIEPMITTNKSNDNSKINLENLPHDQSFWSNISRINLVTYGSQLDNNTLQLNNITFIKTIKADSIKPISSANLNKGSDIIKFPSVLDAFPIVQNNSYIVKAQYDNGIPFIFEKPNKDYNFYYVNVFPIIRYMNSNNSNPGYIYSQFGKILNMSGIELPKYQVSYKDPSQLVAGGISAFSKAIFSGNISLSSPSSILYNINSPTSINSNGSNYIFNNLTDIIPINIDNAQIKSNSAIVQGGTGFYTNLAFQNSSTIRFLGNPAIISLFTDNGKKIIKGNDIQVQLKNFNILSRQPKINFNGIAKFSQFYSYGDLNDKIRTLGQGIATNGKINLNVLYSDRFTISNGTSLQGKVISPQSTFYKNVENFGIFFSSDIKYVSIVLIICIIYNVYLYRKKTNRQ